MYSCQQYISCFLLLLFGRILTPDRTVLAWHPHEHTEDAPEKINTGFELSKKHTHCPTDNLFNAPFAPASPALVKAPLPAFTDTYAANQVCVWKFTFPNNTDLRGPPATPLA